MQCEVDSCHLSQIHLVWSRDIMACEAQRNGIFEAHMSLGSQEFLSAKEGSEDSCIISS